MISFDPIDYYQIGLNQIANSNWAKFMIQIKQIKIDLII